MQNRDSRQITSTSIDSHCSWVVLDVLGSLTWLLKELHRLYTQHTLTSPQIVTSSVLHNLLKPPMSHLAKPLLCSLILTLSFSHPLPHPPLSSLSLSFSFIQYIWERLLPAFKHKNFRSREGICLCLSATLSTWVASLSSSVSLPGWNVEEYIVNCKAIKCT